MAHAATANPIDLEALAHPPDWLAAVADEAAVSAALRPWLPELQSCTVERVRIKQTGFQAVYQATIEQPRASSTQVIPLLGEIVPGEIGGAPPAGPITDPQWRCSLPQLHLRLSRAPADGGLASLSEMTHLQQARALIVDALCATPRYRGYDALAASHRITRYKAGSRCTVVYQLLLAADAPAHWPAGVVAKTYHGDKGLVAWQAMRALWNSPMRTSRWASIAEPLALIRDGQVLLQRAIDCRETLKDAAKAAADGTVPHTDRLHRLARCAGLALADLHASSVSPAGELSWHDELADVRRVIGRLAALVPELSGVADDLLGRLQREATTTPLQAMAPSHGSFRPAQVVIGARDALGMIDFDSFRRAEPAMDVALFCTSLRDTMFRAWLADPAGGVRTDEGLAICDAACEAFIDAYQRSAVLSRQRVAAWETLYVLTGVLHCWTKVKFERLGYRTALLRHHLEGRELT